jgi:hypothetical protein
VTLKTATVRPMPRPRDRRFWLQASAILLLFAVAGLSTGAKDSQYLPNTHPAHYLNISSKMKVSSPAPVLNRVPFQATEKIAPPRFVIRLIHREEPPLLVIQLIGLRMALQHRSPPVALA